MAWRNLTLVSNYYLFLTQCYIKIHRVIRKRGRCNFVYPTGAYLHFFQCLVLDDDEVYYDTDNDVYDDYDEDDDSGQGEN